MPAELLPSPPPPIDKTSAAAAPLVVDVLPPQYSASTRLYEYGGAPYAVLFGDGFGRSRERIVFSDGRDGGLRMLDVATGHVSVVVEPREGIRFGDLDAPDGGDEDAGGRWILAVQEDHTEARTGEGGEEDPSKVKNYVVAIDIKSGTVTRVAEGADFYACPRFAPAAGSVGSSIRRLCWLEWDFPDMPWEGVRLVWAAWNPFGTGKVVGEVQTVAGGRDAGQSAAEPRWSPDGKTLYFALDVGKDWRQLYRVRVGGTNVEPVRLEGLEEVDFGAAAMSMGPYVILVAPSPIPCTYTDASQQKHVRLSLTQHHGGCLRQERPHAHNLGGRVLRDMGITK